uniref:GTP-binding protein Rheb isoform 3 n=1 Tax=Diplonema ambulator TaxID=182243 RepID=A0A2R4IKU1_9EUGL|nr:GTP-binding protein Rheb isoform 3 [Diplonema ambulator]|eukprot:TRINITY_DN43733_c0_g1_i1.p1 TRINITY_DN43733_c0_g1~~TRINITY_DN43733_c0_g1_i1.p1  ORF type:complete len:237 (+),score=29.68 TRINITY_DN43733_c0_g1_i1:64-774(+)
MVADADNHLKRPLSVERSSESDASLQRNNTDGMEQVVVQRLRRHEPFIRQRKLCLFGYRHSGKTSLVEQYIQGSFSHEHYPATNRTSSKIVTRNGHDYLIHVLDTVGQDECGFFDPQYTIGTDGYLLIYSVTDKSSFDMIKRIHQDLWNYTPLVPFVLVANKVDLVDHREVGEEEGRALAQKWACPYTEVTSRSNKEVTQLFSFLLSKIDTAYDDTETFIRPIVPNTAPRPSCALQ